MVYQPIDIFDDWVENLLEGAPGLYFSMDDARKERGNFSTS